MIVIGTDVVEMYLADHAGHKGIMAARAQYEAWLDIVTRANCEGVVPEGKHSQGRSGRLQH